MSVVDCLILMWIFLYDLIGKTLQVLSLAVAHTPPSWWGGGHTLVVAPLSVVNVWVSPIVMKRGASSNGQSSLAGE